MRPHNLIIGLTISLAVSTLQPETGFAKAVAAQHPRARSHTAFPFLRWPSTVVPEKPAVGEAIGHFRFWDGKTLEDVEGHTYLVTLVGKRGSERFDAPRVQGMIENQLRAMGAVRIASGPVPSTAIATINAADKVALQPGLGNVQRDPVQTWVVRRRHNQIWFQFTIGASSMSLAVVETKPN